MHEEWLLEAEHDTIETGYPVQIKCLRVCSHSVIFLVEGTYTQVMN